jgi:hypothetical protein
VDVGPPEVELEQEVIPFGPQPRVAAGVDIYTQQLRRWRAEGASAGGQQDYLQPVVA